MKSRAKHVHTCLSLPFRSLHKGRTLSPLQCQWLSKKCTRFCWHNVNLLSLAVHFGCTAVFGRHRLHDIPFVSRMPRKYLKSKAFSWTIYELNIAICPVFTCRKILMISPTKPNIGSTYQAPSAKGLPRSRVVSHIVNKQSYSIWSCLASTDQNVKGCAMVKFCNNAQPAKPNSALV